MKLAIIKFGGRINANAEGAVGGEVKAAIDLFSKRNDQVDCFTKPLKKDIQFERKNINIYDFNDFENKYDALLIINGNINYFGGQEPYTDLQSLKILNKFKGKLFYFLFDPDLILKQQWRGVELKQDKYSWKNKYTKEEIEITRKDIVLISQPYDIIAVKKLVSKKGIEYKNIIHFPLHLLHLVYYNRLSFNENKTIDLLYGGTFRTGRREDKLIKFYFDYPKDFRVEIFGKITLDKFKEKKIKGLNPPTFTGHINHNEVRQKMSTSIGTVVIGDKWYEGKNISQRVYENILSNTITFIDDSFDPKHIIYKNDFLRNILYVKNRSDIIDVIKKITGQSDSINIIKYICDKQYNDIKIDINNYIENLFNILEK